MLLRPGGLRAFRDYSARVLAASLLGGAAWTVALLCLAASMKMIDLSVAWSLAQLNTIPAVFFGIAFFREVHVPTHWRTLTLGLLAATVGTFLLGWSMNPHPQRMAVPRSIHRDVQNVLAAHTARHATQDNVVTVTVTIRFSHEGKQ